MDDIVNVRIAESSAHFRHDPQPIHHRERAIIANELLEGIPFHAFHHDVRNSVLFAEVIDGDDVRVLQARGLAAFLIEAGQHFRVIGHAACKCLDSYFATELVVESTIHHAHTTAAEDLHDHVLANALELIRLDVLAGVHFASLPVAN